MIMREDAGADYMRDDWGPMRAPFVGGLAIGLAIGIFALLISPVFTVDTYCVAGETTISCMREWSMMFATWFAALVGVGAAYFVYQTIVKMNEQISEARRQTAFAVGDEPPALELKPNNQMFESGRFRVVNWNRRPFFICEARWFADAKVVHMGAIEHNNKGNPVDDRGVLRQRIEIPGWENRSEPPHSFDGEFSLIVDIDRDARDAHRSVMARMELVGYLSGEERRKVTIWAMAPLLEVDLA